MTIGTSAPPTGRTNSTPTARATTASTPSSQPAGESPEPPPVATSTAASATAAASAPPNAYCPPGNVIGRPVISSWSLAKVMQDPAKDTDPTSTVNAPAPTEIQAVPGPRGWVSSSPATSAAA